MADLFPTQDVDDVADTFQDNSDTRKIWGRLLPLRRSLLPVDLVEDCYTFGRGEGCSVMFTPAMFNDPAQFSTFSKQHFKLLQEPCKQGSIVFVEDLSSNGTFINGTKIGRGKRHPLSNNDEISLSLKHYKCYIFSDSNSISDLYPHDVTEKYTVSRLIGRGACGEVRLVFGKQSCEKYAMKIVQKKNFTLSKPGNAFVNRIRSEVDILMKLTHVSIPNCICK
ncbi:unnamed protein product [Calicophoron daubneyi]|uniref:Uncharacterized protein n=1 Tax=Calicophoron daubneyi TaxID=300641 RepID=A0AAV2T3W6_CALDB